MTVITILAAAVVAFVAFALLVLLVLRRRSAEELAAEEAADIEELSAGVTVTKVSCEGKWSESISEQLEVHNPQDLADVIVRMAKKYPLIAEGILLAASQITIEDLEH